MNPIARMAVLDLRTVAPYRLQCLLLFGVVALIDFRSPELLVPALVLLVNSTYAAYPFNIADKARLDTLYAVLPVPRRSVLYGHYAWALATFLATVIAGTATALFLARVQSMPLTGRTLATELTVAWALFAINVAIQFPLFIRYGYTRASALGTTLPLAVIMLAVLKLHPTVASIQLWLPLLGLAGGAAFVVSPAVAVVADQRRIRQSP